MEILYRERERERERERGRERKRERERERERERVLVQLIHSDSCSTKLKSIKLRLIISIYSLIKINKFTGSSDSVIQHKGPDRQKLWLIYCLSYTLYRLPAASLML